MAAVHVVVGNLLVDSEAVAWADAGVSEQPLRMSCNTLPKIVLADMRFARQTQNDSVVAWVDGSCLCNQDARFRRAGCGVFFSTGAAANLSFTLLRREQTNNRAELLSAIAAMRVHEGDLEIRSD